MDQAATPLEGKTARKRRKVSPPTTITTSSFHPLPEGYPFAVSFGGKATDCGTTIQLFRTQPAAERFARATMRPLRMRNDGAGFPSVWATVHALPSGGKVGCRPATLNDSICYMVIDPGGVIVKHHRIPEGYGTAERAS